MNKIIRFTTILENNDYRASASAIVSEAEVNILESFNSRAGVEFKKDEIDASETLYSIDFSGSSNGESHSLRTKEEVKALILQTHFAASPVQPEEIFDAAIAANKSLVSFNDISYCVYVETPEISAETSESAQDALTNYLLEIDRVDGDRGVQAFLRLALSAFASERNGETENGFELDTVILERIADAIRIPLYQHEALAS